MHGNIFCYQNIEDEGQRLHDSTRWCRVVPKTILADSTNGADSARLKEDSRVLRADSARLC